MVPHRYGPDGWLRSGAVPAAHSHPRSGCSTNDPADLARLELVLDGSSSWRVRKAGALRRCEHRGLDPVPARREPRLPGRDVA